MGRIKSGSIQIESSSVVLWQKLWPLNPQGGCPCLIREYTVQLTPESNSRIVALITTDGEWLQRVQRIFPFFVHLEALICICERDDQTNHSYTIRN